MGYDNTRAGPSKFENQVKYKKNEKNVKVLLTLKILKILKTYVPSEACWVSQDRRIQPKTSKCFSFYKLNNSTTNMKIRLKNYIKSFFKISSNYLGSNIFNDCLMIS